MQNKFSHNQVMSLMISVKKHLFLSKCYILMTLCWSNKMWTKKTNNTKKSDDISRTRSVDKYWSFYPSLIPIFYRSIQAHIPNKVFRFFTSLFFYTVLPCGFLATDITAGLQQDEKIGREKVLKYFHSREVGGHPRNYLDFEKENFTRHFQLYFNHIYNSR